jgi:hypothetical protein
MPGLKPAPVEDPSHFRFDEISRKRGPSHVKPPIALVLENPGFRIHRIGRPRAGSRIHRLDLSLSARGKNGEEFGHDGDLSREIMEHQRVARRTAGRVRK